MDPGEMTEGGPVAAGNTGLSEFIGSLMSGGMTLQEASLVASIEMEGAHEDAHGNINAHQTQCGVLHYSEKGAAPVSATTGRGSFESQVGDRSWDGGLEAVEDAVDNGDQYSGDDGSGYTA